MVAPKKDLREIRALAPSDIGEQRLPASTLPSTRATTMPVIEVPLTLADVRQRALRFCLRGLGVTPEAIARVSL